MVNVSSDVYRRLQEHFDGFPLRFPATESGVEIRLLKHLFTPEEAEIALSLKGGYPGLIDTYETLEVIYERIEHLGYPLDDVEKHLDNSGRSQQCIIDLANYLVTWTMTEHPEYNVRDALHAPPVITPAPPGDPQPNPVANPTTIHLYDRTLSPEAEIKTIVDSLQRWLPDHPDDTVAVLVPRNQRGFEVTDALKRAGVPCVELLRSTTSTRKTAGALGNVLKYLANPAHYHH